MTKAQTQANFEAFQRDFPEKLLNEEARKEGVYYLDLPKLFGIQFLNASIQSECENTFLNR